MSRYLLVAEADKIQEFLFRSAHLRQVAGASQLLTRLCDDARRWMTRLPSAHSDASPELVFAAGGKFQLIFADKEEAVQWGADLAEFYRRVTDSTLTWIDDPPAVEPAAGMDYSSAVKEAEQRLRRAKAQKSLSGLEPQAPHWAICSDCGTRFAVGYRTQGPERVRVCRTCRHKANERDDDPGGFWGGFLDRLTELPDYRGGHRRPWRDEREPKEPTEVVRAFDPLGYVAYMIADGNGMGELFGKCKSPAAARMLSEKLPDVVMGSLTLPVSLLVNRLIESERGQPKRYPAVYPLILGGDDVFVLLPAPYALDYAARFCRNFENQMREWLAGNPLFDNLTAADYPGMSAAVVICKSDYPYALAHERGEALLREAKRMSRSLSGQRLSAMSFDVIVGNELADEETTFSGRPRMQRPYWASPLLDLLAQNLGLNVRALLEQRHVLRVLPNTRLVEVRALFDPAGQRPTDDRAWWKSRWTGLLARVGREGDHGQRLKHADEALGNPNGLPGFRRLQRDGSDYLCHGLIDLLEVWDYALDLEKPWTDYRPEENA